MAKLNEEQIGKFVIVMEKKFKERVLWQSQENQLGFEIKDSTNIALGKKFTKDFKKALSEKEFKDNEAINALISAAEESCSDIINSALIKPIKPRTTIWNFYRNRNKVRPANNLLNLLELDLQNTVDFCQESEAIKSIIDEIFTEKTEYLFKMLCRNDIETKDKISAISRHQKLYGENLNTGVLAAKLFTDERKMPREYFIRKLPNSQLRSLARSGVPIFYNSNEIPDTNPGLKDQNSNTSISSTTRDSWKR
ncbi:MAG: hypothetical protein SFV53_05125 [Rickettsiales bacterium]|nr:hypothetical protein [Rickettsiales bacterium]